MLLSPLSNIAYLSDRDPVTYFLYFVVNSCGTPLVYYLGIEENRRQAQDYFRTISIRVAPNTSVLRYSRIVGTE